MTWKPKGCLVGITVFTSETKENNLLIQILIIRDGDVYNQGAKSNDSHTLAISRSTDDDDDDDTMLLERHMTI